MIKSTNSVTGTIAKSLLHILLLSIATTAFAIITLSSSLDDAEAVNVSGSMRMQSYRLAHDIQSKSVNFNDHIRQFEASLYSRSMKSQQAWFVPNSITQDYYRIIVRWHQLKEVLASDNPEEYLDLVQSFVAQIDDFVLKLQQFSEQKLIVLGCVGGMGLGGILLISIFVVSFVRREVVRPLNALMLASQQIKNREFDVDLPATSTNEMGVLTRMFNTMATDLGKMYRGLELAVDEKTHKLQHVNQSLKVLYQCSQELTVSRISQDNFQAILKHIISIDGMKAVSLEITEIAGKTLILHEGENGEVLNHQMILQLDGQPLGYLYFECGPSAPDSALMGNFVQILSRAIYYNQAQKKAEQLMIMEERATIARELHDSLAQSLSYLKIQMALLKRMMSKLPEQKHKEAANQIVADIESGLTDAYTQLRELLTTFRLTIKEGNFGQAVDEMLSQLSEQTETKIKLYNNLSSVELDAHQQVHLLQLIREATINAIKHAQANNINVYCDESNDEVTVSIEDDGVGFDTKVDKINHYGMTIMQERAARLNGHLIVETEEGAGCTVILKYKNIKEV
ncbi:nitrate/nitrite two-component system sensor histidine kinase NarQ [Vibrio sp. 10N.286.49.B3]|uniref:nitrate/nitrite two-component system sensor histidine kinase NarQ n=1 Tax=Vibrio sp. 10N.286.49.B3 TaxID=1880855 RepID=UPI001F535EF5|nr:nitrate/nitrite two-component system sensor histidine kinase NarQ [Vibrio sp. 10N.286.49.B3]